MVECAQHQAHVMRLKEIVIQMKNVIMVLFVESTTATPIFKVGLIFHHSPAMPIAVCSQDATYLVPTLGIAAEEGQTPLVVTYHAVMVKATVTPMTTVKPT